jgi:hypothetical protein
MFAILGIVLLIGILWFIVKFFDSKNEALKALAYSLGFLILAIMFFGGGPTNF